MVVKFRGEWEPFEKGEERGELPEDPFEDRLALRGKGEEKGTPILRFLAPADILLSLEALQGVAQGRLADLEPFAELGKAQVGPLRACKGKKDPDLDEGQLPPLAHSPEGCVEKLVRLLEGKEKAERPFVPGEKVVDVRSDTLHGNSFFPW